MDSSSVNMDGLSVTMDGLSVTMDGASPCKLLPSAPRNLHLNLHLNFPFLRPAKFEIEKIVILTLFNFKVKISRTVLSGIRGSGGAGGAGGAGGGRRWWRCWLGWWYWPCR